MQRTSESFKEHQNSTNDRELFELFEKRTGTPKFQEKSPIDFTDYSPFTQWPCFYVGFLLAFRAQLG